MSACISNCGEFSDHVTGIATYTCGRCGTEDWPAAMAHIARLEDRLASSAEVLAAQFARANRLHELAEDRLVMIEDVKAVAIKARHTPHTNDPYHVAMDIADEIDDAIEVAS